MDDTNADNLKELRGLSDRLARLEERSGHRDERMARMEEALEHLTAATASIASDLRDAKTGLRVMLWFATTLVPAVSAAVGWFAHLLWPGK